MSILVNLLPDVRQAKLKERRRRQLVSGVSVAIWVVCGGVVLLMTLYNGSQKLIIANHDKSITQARADLQNVPGLLDALTAQQHLESLPSLYSQRVYMTKFFKAMGEANPQDTVLESLNVDAQNLMVVNGSGKTYAAVAKLARALEASNVKVGTGASESNQPYFTDVQITNVAKNSKGVSFSISAALAPGVVSGN